MSKVVVISLLFLMFSCGLAKAEDHAVVARIGERVITMTDLERFVGYHDAEKQKFIEQNPQAKKALLRRIVQGIVISKIARGKGFEGKATVKEQLEMLANDFLAMQYVKDEVIAKISVTEEEGKIYYKVHQEEFKTPEMVRARHILIRVDKNGTEEDRKKARGKAEEILKRVRAGEDFAKIATEVSDDAGSKTKGGDLGFFPKGRMASDFEKAAFSLKPGEVSDIVQTPYGFHIIRVEEKKAPAIEPYEKVKDRVREAVFNDYKKIRVEEFLEKALKEAGVEFNYEPLLQGKNAPGQQ